MSAEVWPGYVFGDYTPSVASAWKNFIDKHCRIAKDGKPAMCICPYDSKKFTDSSDLSTILIAVEEFEKHFHENPDHEHKLGLEAARIERISVIKEVAWTYQPSGKNHDEWNHRARCPFKDCRKWNILDFEKYPLNTCDHFLRIDFHYMYFKGVE